jgi:phage-related protein
MKPEKPIRWMGSSRRDLTAFPGEARQAAGYNLRLVQNGLMPEDWKPVESVGPGTYEVRISRPAPDPTQYRVFFVAKFEEAVYVLHAFEKKSRKTSQHDLNLGRARYAEMVADRNERRRKAQGR